MIYEYEKCRNMNLIYYINGIVSNKLTNQHEIMLHQAISLKFNYYEVDL